MSLDTPGRSELLGMQSSLAYQGCTHCLHTWSAGAPLGQSKCVSDGYRRFLAPTSRARRSSFTYNGQVYEFAYAERRQAVKNRDWKLVRDAVKMAKHMHNSFLGHKIAPLIARWPGVSEGDSSWFRLSPGELLHGELCLIHHA